MQTLGATLLAAFTRQQVPPPKCPSSPMTCCCAGLNDRGWDQLPFMQVAADYLARVEAFVPTLCQLALSPGPVAGVHGQASTDALLKSHIACLHALQEQVRLW